MNLTLAPVREDPVYPFLPPRPSSGPFTGLVNGRLPELHLYDGSRCNRACAFCAVAGSPRGWYRPFGPEVLEFALELVSPRGSIKFYGGEPTLHPENVVQAVAFLEQGGFVGRFRLYSNGIRAEVLTEVLDAVPEMDAVLNYSILHGRGVPSIPRHSLELLLGYERGRIFSGHPDLVDVGAAGELPAESVTESFGGACAHCHPVLRSDGIFHGCPFAVENRSPHFQLGGVGSPAGPAVGEFEKLIRWQSEVLEPEARRRGLHPCQVCDRHLEGLPEPG